MVSSSSVNWGLCWQRLQGSSSAKSIGGKGCQCPQWWRLLWSSCFPFLCEKDSWFKDIQAHMWQQWWDHVDLLQWWHWWGVHAEWLSSWGHTYDARNTMIQVMDNVYCLQNGHPAQCGALERWQMASRDSSRLHTLWLGHLHHCEPQLPLSREWG